MSADRELAAITAAQRDPSAFGPLYEAYADLVWRYAMSRLRSEERAADATSQTFTRAIAALPRFNPERRGDSTTFRSWLMLIARNVVIDDVRRHRPTLDLDDPAAQSRLVASEPSPEAHALANDRQRQILSAFTGLSDQQQKVVRMRLEGASGQEIADELGISANAVKAAHYRGIVRLREILAEQEDHS